ncbi:hypothetical protein CYMTET_38347 [Cymbomonas tetramitiformis]|uniref:UvrD-like helicase C-terminal domain-containing protein n=1 Tax=Cymbomonas tetramitiformis TaxID=36881 RepID=A0AAE0CC60_9CHLO|nr:hypothetical protein CYMTET_38347 [Cymbomonas tetramitiformis]
MSIDERFARSTPQQRAVLEHVLVDGRNVLLLGGAGTGKSDTIHLVRELWTERDRRNPARALGPAVVTSPIGCAAARHPDGCTLDALFAVGALSDYDLCVARFRKKLVAEHGRKRKVGGSMAPRRDGKALDDTLQRLRAMGLLIVEEVTGMCAGKLKLVDALLRVARTSKKPFGGVAVLLVGDFLQLDAPTANGANQLYKSPLLVGGSFVVHVLRANLRQVGDARYAELLERVRRGACTEEDLSLLRTRTVDVAPLTSDAAWYLCSTNDSADERNRACHDRLSKSAHSREYVATFRWRGKNDEDGVYVDGPANLGPLAVSSMPVEVARAYRALTKRHHGMASMSVCVGARVMLTQNRDRELSDRRMMNGRRGTVRATNADGMCVCFDDAPSELCELPVRAARVAADFPAGADCELRYMPVKLAWASTIHKAQGGEADCVVVDCDRLFDPRLFYVGVSRCRTLGGLTLLNFHSVPDMQQLPEATLYEQLERWESDKARLYDCGVDGPLAHLA